MSDQTTTDPTVSELQEQHQRPDLPVARCGQLSVHRSHVVEHGPDQPRICPGARVGEPAPWAPAFEWAEYRDRRAAEEEG